MDRPLPNGIEVNPFEKLWTEQFLSELVAPHVAKNIYDLWEKISGFFAAHALTIFIIIFAVGILNFFYKMVKKRQYNVQKLWHFILFFLSKRQMMIPLLCKLGERENALSEKELQRLIDIRQKCREHTMKDSPQERIKLEAEVSEILFNYFQTLEKDGKLHKESTFRHIVKDLEYIDEKLVELQSIYNGQANKWNKSFGHFKFLGLHHFQLFQ